MNIPQNAHLHNLSVYTKAFKRLSLFLTSTPNPSYSLLFLTYLLRNSHLLSLACLLCFLSLPFWSQNSADRQVKPCGVWYWSDTAQSISPIHTQSLNLALFSTHRPTYIRYYLHCTKYARTFMHSYTHPWIDKGPLVPWTGQCFHPHHLPPSLSVLPLIVSLSFSTTSAAYNSPSPFWGFIWMTAKHSCAALLLFLYVHACNTILKTLYACRRIYFLHILWRAWLVNWQKMFNLSDLSKN